MRKIFLFFCFISTIFFSQSVKAVSYRGIVEGGFGYLTSNSANHSEQKVGIDAFVTNGIQVVKPFYVGITLGYGWCQEFYESEHRLKIGGDIRWDGFGIFGIGKRVNPFIDLKLGYNLPISDIGSYDFASLSGGFFLRPSLGIRLRLSSKVGFNFSIFYNLINRIYCKNIEYYDRGEHYYTGNLDSHQLGIGIGVDF